MWVVGFRFSANAPFRRFGTVGPNGEKLKTMTRLCMHDRRAVVPVPLKRAHTRLGKGRISTAIPGHCSEAYLFAMATQLRSRMITFSPNASSHARAKEANILPADLSLPSLTSFAEHSTSTRIYTHTGTSGVREFCTCPL